MSTVIAHHRDIIYTVSDKFDSNPVLWLSADRNITLNGNNVSGWEDRSGNGYNASQGTPANQPLYVPKALNGKPVLRFDENFDQFLNLIPFTFNSNQTFYAVLKKQNAGVNMSILGNSASTLTINNYLNGASYVLINDTTVEHVSGHYIDYAIMSFLNVNGVISMFKNGVFLNSQTTFGAYKTADNIGKQGNLYYSSGDIAEIIIYNQALSDTQRQTVENYLKQKYNL